MQWTPLFALCCSCLVASVNGKANHEWGGIFEVPNAKYLWTVQKVKGSYGPDSSMKIAAVPTSAATEAILIASKQKGTDALNGTCTDVQAGKVMVLSAAAAGVCYNLQFNGDLWQSLYTIDASSVANVAFFTEHVPTEFEATAHYLKDKNGTDIEPAAEYLSVPKAKVAHDDHKDPDWGNSIGAAILICIVTMVGLVLAVPGFLKVAQDYANEFEGILSAFAAGALLACACFLLLFEATHLVATGWSKEVETLWRWGTMVLAGFVLPAVVEAPATMMLEAMSKKKPAQQENAPQEDGEAAKEQAAEEKPEEASASTKFRVISAVIIGDFMHNLCDGFFVGAAFKGCGNSLGWKISAATILHEIPQELADYAILTGTSVGMKPPKALFLNFLSGLSVILGVIIVNGSDLKDKDIGLILAFGAGVYVYLAAVECMPKASQLGLSAKMKLACLLAFIVGAVLIGLILLDHEHCVPDSAAGGSGGGGHAH